MRVLVTGASGQLGAYVLRHFVQCGVSVVAWSGSSCGDLFDIALNPVDLAETERIEHHLDAANPDLIIHCAAVSGLGEAYQNQARASAVNSAATVRLAALATERRCRLVYISTDLVFDGEQGNYTEEALPRPVTFYGRTKLAGEAAVGASPRGLVLRVSLLYGTSLIDRPTFLDQLVQAMRQGSAFRLFDDEWRTPLDFATAATAIATVAESDTVGLLHLGGATKLSRHQMGLYIAAASGLRIDAIQVASRLSVGGPEPRPRDTSLKSERFEQMFPQVKRPSFDESLTRYVGE